jgi:hypothetical protein
MNYKTFEKLMKELVSIKEDEDNLNKAFRKFEPDFNYIGFWRYETLVVKAIQEVMNDEYDYIGYWLYEVDCGKKAKVGTVTDEKGKNIPIKTLKNLYDVITNH